MIELIKEFNEVFSINTDASILNIKARKEFILSELDEYIEDPKKVDTYEDKLTAQFDAVIDALYYTLGACTIHNYDPHLLGRMYLLNSLNSNEMVLAFASKQSHIRDLIELVNNYEKEALSFTANLNVKPIHIALDKILYSLLLLSAKHGFLHKLEQGFIVVHSNNMDKLQDGKVIRDKLTNKVLKPEGHKPPDLKKVLF